MTSRNDDRNQASQGNTPKPAGEFDWLWKFIKDAHAAASDNDQVPPALSKANDHWYLNWPQSCNKDLNQCALILGRLAAQGWTEPDLQGLEAMPTLRFVVRVRTKLRSLSRPIQSLASLLRGDRK